MPNQQDDHKAHGTAKAVWSDFCAVAPSPELKDRLKAELAEFRTSGAGALANIAALARAPRYPGFDDGTIIPPDHFPAGTPAAVIRASAAERAPLRGTVRIAVILVQFSDKAIGQSVQHFKDLFFSTGVLPNGSVKEYFREVTNNLIDLTGEVVGPFQLPQTLAWYANGNFGIGRPTGTPRANIMAKDSAVAADSSINFGIYDNDGNGFVDAFIVVHAGGGGEATGNSGDIWSHKWTLPSAYSTDGKQIFAYLTIPEDAKIGVCAHELGHLLFGFPDLYDTDDTSEGVGNWCLMGGGSWNGGGDIPAHPSAWCKAQQGWATVTNVTTSGTVVFPDVKTSHNVHRLWKDGGGGPEYFLVENRQKTNYDAQLPGSGLLIWHIDENQPGNTDENHYKVGLVQADNKRDLELSRNRGDAGDPYPGSANNTAFNNNSTPSSKSFGGQNTCVSIGAISPSGATMTASVSVACGKSIAKDSKDQKDTLKDSKDGKETKEGKEGKDTKELRKEIVKEVKELRKELIKEVAKDRKDLKDRVEVKAFDRPPFGRTSGATGTPSVSAEAFSALEARVAAIEAAVTGVGPGGAASEPFIGSDLRPDLLGAPDYSDQQSLQTRMAAGDRDAKITFDNLPQ
jgi:immune inhibitor A